MRWFVAGMALMVLAGGAGARPDQPPAPPGRAVKVKTPLYSFAYSYPAAAGRIPALKAWMEKDLANTRGSIAGQARDDKDQSRGSTFPFIPYDAQTEWQVVTDLPGWLSLSGMQSEYTGGAHPNHGPAALLWNKAAGKQVEALDLFDKAAFGAAIGQAFCAALNKERGARRGEPVDPHGTGMFDTCPDPVKEVVILGSGDHQHFTRIGILIGPYDAGPYAEGDYDITIPVTPAVLAAVKPPYRSAFAVAR